MPVAIQRSPRVLYVAGSARELPEEVRDWLADADNRAVAAPDIYEALACLTKRPRPAALIVNIESVDWEEMEFFDLAGRLSRETTIYVTGHNYHRAKIEAALQRGAKLFNPDDLAQDLARPAPGTQRFTPGDLLAGTIDSFPQVPDRQLHITLVPEEADQPPVRAEPGGARQTAQRPVEAEISLPAGDAADKPPVRLVTPADIEDEALAPTDEIDTTIPFPWAPSPSRPQRTPPPIAAQSAAGQPRTPPAPPPQQPAPAAAPRGTSSELTAEELAALVGRPIDPPPDAQEQAS